MNIKEAVEVLKEKAETPEQKRALALLVCELDTQFCYGWGAGCSGTAEWINKTVLATAPPTVQEKIENVAMWMASSPKADGFRSDDFPQIDEFLKIIQEQQKDEIPF